MNILGYWPPRETHRGVLVWLPYAHIAGTDLYYEALYAPRLEGCRRLLGFTRIRVKPLNKPPPPNARVAQDTSSINIREVLESCRRRIKEARATWEFTHRGQPLSLTRLSNLLRERLLIPSPLPRISVTVSGIEEALAARLLEELNRLLPREAKVRGYYMRPFVCADGVLKDAAGIGDGHERIVSRYAQPCQDGL